MPPGFREAYRAYVEGGWGTLAGPAEFGGQGLPLALASVVMEDLGSANMGFSLVMMLTPAAVEALKHHGTPDLRQAWLPKLITGEWTGTMNLTEPQAGSDVGALKTRAEPRADGSYRITGQKIFITFGEHDLADNIVHLVLARLPDAPGGTQAASRCSWCRRSCPTAAATTSAASRSSTSSASTPRRPASWPMATRAAPPAG